ncbi:MAG: HD-GYP domain-containing protein [Phycisphaerales bacterium]|nr:HD-GYP domain-containing protein [Phycisphaerales bacterium]
MPTLSTSCVDTKPAWAGLSTETLTMLSGRLRLTGLCLSVFKCDGSLYFSDPEAGLFFTRFALPLVQFPEDQSKRLATLATQLTTEAAPLIWEQPAGAIFALVPYVERRQVQAMLLITAKSKAFGATEDVMRVCGRLGLDSTWLVQQADSLPAFSPRVMRGHARLLATLTEDQLRFERMQEELNGLSGQLSDTYEELNLIYRIGSYTRVNGRPMEFFKQVCLSVLEVMDVRGIGVSIKDDTLREFPPVLYGEMSLPPGKIHRLADDLIPLLSQHKGTLLVNDLRHDPSLRWLSEYARQIIAVALQRQGKIMGCLFAIDKNSDDFDSMDGKLLGNVANKSAIYLQNSVLFEDVHDLMMGLMHSLTSAVDAKDAYTCGHSERVALLTRQLATEMHLPEATIERFYMAGLLHDVGKIGVPEAVLHKEGRLTDEEFAQIKKHPEMGARILSDIKQVADIIPGILHHHERWDGRGYPYGLSGSAIPLMGRVICLADSFDAMTSNRTYRKALPLEVAIAEIQRSAGSQFDPELAELFVNVGIDRYLSLLHEYEHKQKRPFSHAA